MSRSCILFALAGASKTQHQGLSSTADNLTLVLFIAWYECHHSHGIAVYYIRMGIGQAIILCLYTWMPFELIHRLCTCSIISCDCLIIELWASWIVVALHTHTHEWTMYYWSSWGQGRWRETLFSIFLPYFNWSILLIWLFYLVG